MAKPKPSTPKPQSPKPASKTSSKPTAKRGSHDAKPSKQFASPPPPADHAQVIVPFAHHWKEVDAEVLWAVPLGNDCFELRNVPFYAYGLSWGDVVRALAHESAEHPVVEKLVSKSGHQTMRIFMDDDVAELKSVAMLESLERFGASYERHSGGFIAIDIAPDGDYDGVFDQLDAWEAEGLLGFETCESRVANEFGSDPSEG